METLISEGVDPQNAEDWLVARKAKGLPLTPTAWQQTKDEAAKAGISPAEAIRVAAGNGWAGFKSSWTNGSQGGTGQMSKQEALEARNAQVVKRLSERFANES